MALLRRVGFALAPGRARDLHDETAPPPGDVAHSTPGAVTQQLVLLDASGAIVAVIASPRIASPRAADGESSLRIGSSYADACRAIHPALRAASLRRGIADVVAGRTPSFIQAYRLGPQRRWQVCVTPMAASGMSLFVAVDEDITEAPGPPIQVDATTGDLLAVQEAERRRLTMELHDSTSQHLVALGLGMARLRRLVGGGGAQDVLEDMSRSVREVVKEIRVLSYLMRPAALEQHGLATAAKAFVEGFGTRTGLVVDFQARGGVDNTSPAVRHAAFRILQEALSNVYRHANATLVEIVLDHADGVLSIRVGDDGRGIAKIREGHPESLQLGVGIDGMRTRVARLGGDLEINCPERGTQVVVRLPDDAQEAAGSAAGGRPGSD